MSNYYALTLLRKDGEIVDIGHYTCKKAKEVLIQKWKYRYGKKFLELIVEDEKEENNKQKKINHDHSA